jgi:hypothetical protein
MRSTLAAQPEPGLAGSAAEPGATPAAYAQWARAAMRQGDWTETLARWDACLTRFPGRRAPAWHVGRATALRELGRFREAEESLRDLVTGSPDDLRLQVGLARCILERGAAEGVDRRAEVVELLRAGLLKSEVEEHRLVATTILISTGELHVARCELLAVMEQVATARGLARCFSAIPILFERVTRPRLWTQLLAQVDRVIGESDSPHDQERAEDIRLRLWLALEDFVRFTAHFGTRSGGEPSDEHGRMLECVRCRLGLPRGEVVNEPKIFGIGLSKTGTTSLTKALSVLGIDAGHWLNPLTHQLLSDADLYLLGGGTDICVSANFERLFFQYPNAKFILTRRPLASWASSFNRHNERQFWTSDFGRLRDLLSDASRCRHGSESAALYFQLYLNHESPEAAYDAFEARVLHFFADKPREKLLTFDVFQGDGWPELCAFLGRDRPAMPFPWSNNRQQGSCRSEPADDGMS